MQSSYPAETAYGNNNQAAYFYSFSHSVDLAEALKKGQCLTSRQCNGTEQISLTFPSATATGLTLDIYAFQEQIHQVSVGETKALAM